MKLSSHVVVVVVARTLLATSIHGVPCVRRPRGDTYDCVCNATYCDTIELPRQIPAEVFHVYTSAAGGGRFEEAIALAEDADMINDTDVAVDVSRASTLQTIVGFGGALTDATGINLACLSRGAQENFINSYFAKTGLEYSLVRVPIGGTDFSTRRYTNAEAAPVTRTENGWDFVVRTEPEDCDYKIPNLQKILAINDRVRFLGSSWYAPEWMLQKDFTGRDTINPEYYREWAEYHRRFFDLYRAYGVPFWATTTGNEINTAVLSVSWLLREHRDWVTNHLGPVLKQSGYGDMKMLLLDDSAAYMVPWMSLLNNETTGMYIDGIATHWYLDDKFYLFYEYFHATFPDKLLVSTEASFCKYEVDYEEKTMWYGAEYYAEDIIKKVNRHCNGWIDWNMALDPYGGPNHKNNPCDAAVIINGDRDEFYKKPNFYAMGHFSKFVPPGSKRVKAEVRQGRGSKVLATSFLVPDSPWNVAVVLLNKNAVAMSVRLCIDRDVCTRVLLPPRSISSVIGNTANPYDCYYC